MIINCFCNLIGSQKSLRLVQLFDTVDARPFHCNVKGWCGCQTNFGFAFGGGAAARLTLDLLLGVVRLPD